MHSSAVRARVDDLIRSGWSDAAIIADTGLARGTVRYMRERDGARALCPRCWRPIREVRFAAGEYAELLGLYLGDGHIVNAGRSQRLRLFLDAQYPTLAAEARALLDRCMPANRVSVTRLEQRSTLVVSLYSTHMACLFPQHGPGPKHERAIVLEDWQRRIVDEAPWSLLRGLVMSDGCAFINRTGRYRYLSYEFRNRSADIRTLFMSTCDALDVAYTTAGDRIRICTRASVAQMACFVGTKR